MAQTVVVDKCDLCDSEKQVDYFCINCEEVLCLTCKLSHSKSRKTRKDKIISLSQARQDDLVNKSTMVYCIEHSTEETILFCLKCDELICIHCVAGKHGGHNIISPDDVRDSKTEELRKNIQALKEKKVIYENAFQTEFQIHSSFTKSIDKVRSEISDQKAKIIEELNLVCNEQYEELSKLQQNEDKRHSDACNKIQKQNQTVASSIQCAENSHAGNNAALIIQAAMKSTNTLQCLEDPTIPPSMRASYTPGDRSRPNIRHVQGEVNIAKTTTYQVKHDRSHQTQENLHAEEAKHKLMTDIHKVQEQKRNDDDKQQQTQEAIKPREVNVKSTIKVTGKLVIYVIVPLKNETAWVTPGSHKQLLLIDSRGKIITKSVSLDGYIEDAKEYRDGLLVTCNKQHKVLKLTSNGKSASTFSDLSPYTTSGICVTHDMGVLVCLRSSEEEKVNKVVRLNSLGHITQTIQYDTTGAPLYCSPWRVESLTTGDIIVLEAIRPRKITGVDREGQYLFTWEEEIQGKEMGVSYPQHISHDNNNHLFVTDYINDRVCVFEGGGSGAKYLLDSTHGIHRPIGIAVDNSGQLWVCCGNGNIHIIGY